MQFPRGGTADLFRGQLGKILYRRDPAVYARIFAPVLAGGASGLRNPPRPFVLRVRHLEGARVDKFHAGVNVFAAGYSAMEDAIKEIGRESLRAELVAVEGREALRLPLGGSRAAGHVRVHFLSPTELKNAEGPEFGVLFSRIRDRVSTLRALYGEGALEIDFRAMGERARAIRMTRCDVDYVEAAGERRPQGGFTGIAEYEGDLTDFVPYLEIAGYTGVGRQTVWGKGEIAVETF